MDKLQVAILAPAFPPVVGGAETLVADITMALAATDRVAPVVFTANEPETSVVEAVRSAGGEVIVADDQARPGRLLWIHEQFSKAEALQDLLERRDLDLVHVFSYDTAITAAIALPPTRRDRVPVFATFSEITLPERAATEHLRAEFVFSLRALDLYVALSVAYADVALAHGLPADKLHVNRAGVNVERFASGSRRRGRARLGLDDNIVVVTCPSRFKARKGQLELLAALEALDPPLRDLQVILAGSINSADQAYLEAVAGAKDRIGLARPVRLLQDVPRTAMPDLLAASDVVVQPSYFEGLGLAALEAMAAGASVLLTDTHGFNEIGTHLHDAFYVQPRSVRALADGLQTLLASPDLRRRLGARGRKHVREDFDIRDTVDRLVALYEHAASRLTLAPS